MFTKLLSKFRKPHAPEGLSEEMAKDRINLGHITYIRRLHSPD